MEDGLSNLSVLSICQDTLGRMWFGTNEGVNIYDGTQVTRIKSYEMTSSNGTVKKFMNGRINQIVGDCSGRIFINNNRALVEYDVLKERFTEIHPQYVRALTIINDRLWCFVRDSLCVYNPEDKVLSLYERLPLSTVNCMVEYKGDLYIGTVKGLYRWNGKELEVVLPDIEIYRLFVSSLGEMWIGSRMNGLYRINRRGDLLKEECAPDRVISGQIREFVEDSNHFIWFGTFEGLQVYDPYKDSFKVYRPGTYPGLLEHESVFSLYRDKQGTIWLGSYYGGVNYFNLGNDLFTYYHPFHEKNGKCLNFSVIGQIVEDSKHDLWIATDGGGVNRYHRQTATFSYFEASVSDPNSIPHDNVKTLAYDKEHNCIYIGTYTGGLSRYDIGSGRFYNYLKELKGNEQGPNNSIYYCLYKDGYLYVAAGNGLWALNVETNQFDLLSSRQFFTLGIDTKKKLWMASDNSLCKMDLQTRKVMQHTELDRYMNREARVTKVMAAKDGTVYFSTLGSGVFSYNYVTDSVQHYTSGKNGLLSDYCYNLAETPMNHILITNDRGISIYSPFNGTVRSIELQANKGMISAVTEGGGICIAGDDRIYIGGVNGMMAFNERELYESYKADANFYFANLSVNNKRVVPEGKYGILKQSLPFTQKVDLAYDQNNISLVFANSNYIALDRTTAYQYKMEGFDEEWIPTDHYELNYTNLPPGNYRLRVRETGNKLGASYNKEIALGIHIHHPWFANGWAYLTYLLVLLGVFYGLWRIRRARQQLAVSLENERVEKERIEEVNKMKLRFFTNISHEFRTPLTLIVGQTEMLLQTENFSPVAARKMRNIYRNALHLRFLITELLDFRKQEQGFLKLKVECRNIVALVKDVCSSFDEWAKQRSINYSIDCVETEILVWFDPMQLQKVFYNLLANAFKYTPAHGSITVIIHRLQKNVEITIADTGCGIPTDAHSKIFERFYQGNNNKVDIQETGSGIGLAFSKGIVEAHHGSIRVESVVEKGSKFTVSLLLGNEHFSAEELEHEYELLTTDEHTVKWVAEETEEDQPESVPDKENANRPVVLVVEDDVEMRKMLVEIFHSSYQVHQAANGQEGYELACSLHPDLIVSDVMMPVMSGKEMCHKIKNNLELAYVPVVLLTAQVSEDYVIEGYQFGADAYIPKPFNVKLLLTRCGNLLANRKALLGKVSAASQRDVPRQEVRVLSELDHKLLDKVTDIIRSNFDNPEFDMDMLAAELHIGRNKMFARIKEITGLTPNEFALKMKLEEALSLLQNEPQLNIAEISYRLGFSSPRYFSRSFKNFYGVSPQAYRKKESGDSV